MPNRFIWLKDPGMTVARDYLDFGWEQTSAEIVSALGAIQQIATEYFGRLANLPD
jgi:hypothetical protein